MIWPFKKANRALAEAERCKSLGNAQKEAGELAAALASYRRSLEFAPDYLPSLYNLGLLLRESGETAEAERCFRRVRELDARDADALFHLGALLYERSSFAEAGETFRAALRLSPQNASLWLFLGRTCKNLAQMQEALAAFRKALELEAGLVDAHNDLANILQDEGRLDDAVEHYRAAIRLAPEHALAYSNLGSALARAHRLDEAAESLRKAVALAPDYAGAHLNLGSVRSLQGARDEALAHYRSAAALRPEDASIRECLLTELQNTCDWSRFEELSGLQRRSALDASQHVAPFSLLSLPSTRAEQLICARNFSQRLSAVFADRRRVPGFRLERRPAAQLTIGYLSADFQEHATAYLAAELFELHDRNRFRVFGYSYGADDGSRMRARLRCAFDRFVDLEKLSDPDAAAAIRADGVDILVDMKGHTSHARTAIVALRPAPVQASYLGYPGTMGADFIDYLLADRFVTPPAHADSYRERLVLMPGSYQVNDRRRRAADSPSREQLGLPADAVVFCCFNQPYKILPQVFAVWMRLLAAIPGSVLWLLDWNGWATQNLRREARERGVAAERLIFAPKLPLELHLGRLGAADIFLDTFPYNAHTTASDALWVGLPVVTCAGETFASRVAGSLLGAIGMPELVTASIDAYEALALHLARHPDELGALREKLSRNRDSTALFDTTRFTRNLETAYQRMWAGYVGGEAPHVIDPES